jgi:glycerophosphoryl diester phosphodiesterase
VDLIETDVRFQDGKMVVRHERKLGSLPILADEKTSLHIGGEHGWRLPLWRWFIALQRNPLALQEVLAEAKDKRGLLLDLKGEYGGREEALARGLADMLQRTGMEEQATICGLNWALLEHLRAAAPHLKVYYSIGSADQLEAFQAMLERDPIRGICLNHSLAEEHLIERLKGLGVTIYTWAVDDLRRARELLELGIDGVISNSLEMLSLLDAGPRQERQA